MNDQIINEYQLESGSRITLKETNKGRIVQLFLNTEEYQYLKDKYHENYYIHFYGGNYIYIGPNANRSEVLEYLHKKYPQKTKNQI